MVMNDKPLEIMLLVGRVGDLTDKVEGLSTSVAQLNTTVAVQEAEQKRAERDRAEMAADIKTLLVTSGNTQTLLQSHIEESRDYHRNGPAKRLVVTSGATGGGIAVVLGSAIAAIGKALGAW